MIISPALLPKYRDQAAQHLCSVESHMQQSFEHLAPVFDHLGQQLPAARLWWVTEDMAALSIGAAQTLPDVRFLAEDMPSPVGMIVYKGGIGEINLYGTPVPIDGISWGPNLLDPESFPHEPTPYLEEKSEFRDFWIWFWVFRSRLPNVISEEVPPIIPVCAATMEAARTHLVEDLDPRYRTPVATLAATWYLMAQRNVSTVERVPVDRKVRRSYSRAHRPDPEVSLVEVRRNLVYPKASDDTPGGERRGLKVRFLVGHHWRWQRYGPGLSQQKRIFIADFMKGPDGAPLSQKTRVNVWRH